MKKQIASDIYHAAMLRGHRSGCFVFISRLFGMNCCSRWSRNFWRQLADPISSVGCFFMIGKWVHKVQW